MSDFDDDRHFDEPADFDDPNDYGRKPPRSNGMGGCGKAAVGCAIVIVCLLVMAGVGGWWVANNWQNLAAGVMKAGIGELKLPEEQQQRIFARIDELTQMVKDGELTGEQAGAIVENIVRGPLFPAGMALIVQRAYLENSGLDEDEKAAARTTIQRFTHGAVREMISEDELNEVLDHISTRQPNNQRQFKQKLTDQELRDFIAAAKEAADQAEVPDEVPEVNFADEFDEAIDEGLEKAGKAPANAA